MFNSSTFYQTAELSVPPDLPHRQIKVRKGKHWISFRVKSIEELRKKLIQISPDAVFVSTSCYLNPDQIEKKWSGNYTSKNPLNWNNILNNVIISSSFVLDFDKGDTRFELEKAWHYLKSIAGFSNMKICRTKRGFHLWILDFYSKRCRKIENPKQREEHISAQKRKLADELMEKRISFDYPISIDCRRIVRLWGSLYDDRTLICKAYNSLEELDKDNVRGYNSELEDAKKGSIGGR